MNISIGGVFGVKCESCDRIHELFSNDTSFDRVASESKAQGLELTFLWEDNVTCDCGNEFIDIEYLLNAGPENKINWREIRIENGEMVSEFYFTFINEA